jgi:hypothetical protein
MKKLIASIIGVVVIAGWVLWPPHVSSHETLTTTVLFDREIVRILDKHCVMCHVANGISFPLATYEETWLKGRPLRAEVLARHMPPWPAVQGYGQFANENALTLRETQFVVSWVEGLGPRNAGTVFLNVLDPKAAPRQEVRAHADFGHWEMGDPNLTRELSPATIEAGQANELRRTVIDLGLTAERRLRGLEYMPGERRLVRAATFSVQETGQWLGSWTPWYGFVKLPDRTAYRIPAGAHIVAEISYRGGKERLIERGMLGLYFADAQAANVVSDLVLETKGEVPAGASLQRFRAQTRLTSDIYAVALKPEILPGMTSIEVSARRPDGGTDMLLFAKDFSLDWPTPYILKDPMLLRRGAELSVTAYYANPTTAPHAGGVRLTVSRY